MPAMTFADMQRLDEEHREKGDTQAFSDLVYGQVKKCIANPERYRNKPLTLLSALQIWEWQPVHQCYWNNRFVIAVMCNMSLWRKQQGAWGVICNGHIGYFEWTTHAGYEMANVFRYLGIEGVSTHSRPKGYSNLPRNISEQLALMFDLPTVTYRRGKVLSEDEHRYRDELNALNSKFSIL